MKNQTLIYHLKDIRHFYGDKPVLDIREFKISKGSIIGLTGPNGSGKSTLLKLLAFINRPTQGQILYKGKPEFPFSPAVRSKVTLMTQKPYLLKRTVFENIAYGLKIRKDTDQLEKRIDKALSRVGLDFKKFSQRMWHELSGGEAQRVAMAARLILKPETLLLDEPVASVDVKSAGLIREAALKARNEWGTTLVIASHDLTWLFSFADRQVSILNGKLFSTGNENIITGPFEPGENNTVLKRLDNQKHIRIGAPPGKDNFAAMIKKEKIQLEKQPADCQESHNRLKGQIVSMNLEEKQNLIVVKIKISSLIFDLSLTSEEISRMNLYPGKTISVCFSPDDVEWI